MTTFKTPVETELADGSTFVSLHDGIFKAGNEILVDPAGESQTAALRARYPDGIAVEVNAFALRRGDDLVLIDAGCGTVWGPGLGNAARSVVALGVAPDAVRTILLTHPHGDHAFGLLDDAGEALRYPNAEVYCPAVDIDHFSAPADAGRDPSRPIIRKIFEKLGPRLRPYGVGEVLPGIEAVSLPGHTPGHSGFLIASLLLVWGDALHLPELQALRPELGLVFDIDPTLAAATRRQLLATVAEKQWDVAGMHLPFPGLARVDAEDAGYRIESLDGSAR